MPESRHRITRKINEIRAAIQSVRPGTDLFLWIHRNEERITFGGNLLSFNAEENLLQIRLIDPPSDLAQDEQVYVRFLRNSAVGKYRILSQDGVLLSLEVSDELIVEEKRKHRRIVFRIEDEKKITLKMNGQESIFGVINVSRSGVRVRCTHETLEFARSAGSIVLTSLGDRRVEVPSLFIRGDASQFALHFKVELEDQDFEAFITTPLLRKVSAEKFFNDQEYLDTVRSNMEQTIERLERRPKFATAMKTLKVDRDGSYVKTHIDLLCYVSCSVGRMLGWVTKKTLDKLILASYLHDIRYFEHPKLARIATFAEFQGVKARLTLEEQRIFLEGPEYSSTIAKDDLSDSTDVERILVQQKERPDGSGFPAGVDFKQLFPLSCLFMVCHEFVDYIYSTPKWSFKEFTAKARAIYKGPYFIKILEAFDELS